MNESTDHKMLDQLVCCCGKPAERCRVVAREQEIVDGVLPNGDLRKRKMTYYQPYGWACNTHWVA